MRATRPLLVTQDPQLLDDVLSFAAAGGVELEVAGGRAGAAAGWSAAPVVLVGADVLTQIVRHPLPRRDDVVVVTREPPDAAVWRPALDLGASDLIVLPEASGELLERLADAGSGSRSAPVVGVVGGSGGAGASTFAAALCRTAARRSLRPLLVDADALGGGADLLLQAEDRAGVRWSDLRHSRGRVHGDALLAALPVSAGVSVLSCDVGEPLLDADAVAAVVTAARRAVDLVVVDHPRRLESSEGEVLERCDLVIVCVLAQVRAVSAAARVLAALSGRCRDVRIVVRAADRSGLPAETVSSLLDAHVQALLPREPRLAHELERGVAPGDRWRGGLARSCGQLLDEVLAGRRA